MISLELDEKLRYLYRNVPHHHEQITEKARKRVNSFHNWDSLILVSNKLTAAYPLRKPEFQPAIISYTEGGERVIHSGTQLDPSDEINV
jgi:UDP-N-acetylglucosamine pyrophosphorylase